MTSTLRFGAFISLLSITTLANASVLFQDSFSSELTDRNRFGSDRGDFAYHTSYAVEQSLLNAVSAPFVGVKPFDASYQQWADQKLKVLAHSNASSPAANNVVQVASYFDRTTIAKNQTISFSADVHTFAYSNVTAFEGINNAMRFGLVNMETLPTTHTWNRGTAPDNATTIYEGTGSSTFGGTGFMSNIQTGVDPYQQITTRITPYNRIDGSDQRLATNTAGWFASSEITDFAESASNQLAYQQGEGVKFSINQSVTRVDDNVFEIQSSMTNDQWGTLFSNWTFTAEEGRGDAWATFDTLFFTVNSGALGFERTLWDNFHVAVVPEPNRVVLGMLAFMALIFRRRR